MISTVPFNRREGHLWKRCLIEVIINFSISIQQNKIHRYFFSQKILGNIDYLTEISFTVNLYFQFS